MQREDDIERPEEDADWKGIYEAARAALKRSKIIRADEIDLEPLEARVIPVEALDPPDELFGNEPDPRYQTLFDQLVLQHWLRHTPTRRRRIQFEAPTFQLASLIIPKGKSHEGTLVSSQAVVWDEIVEAILRDQSAVFQLNPYQFEELIAGAFHKAGYDEVTLTPKSGDGGRDVIAIRHGVGTIKIISSVKMYSPGHVVGYDDIRALAGVLMAEVNASKGILTTTSRFPPRVEEDKFLKALMPTRLELMDGDALVRWLASLKR